KRLVRDDDALDVVDVSSTLRAALAHASPIAPAAVVRGLRHYYSGLRLGEGRDATRSRPPGSASRSCLPGAAFRLARCSDTHRRGSLYLFSATADPDRYCDWHKGRLF